MNCPVCSDTQLVMSERQGVEIDYCPRCRGIWLDRGELDKIIQLSTAQHAPRQQAPQQPPHYTGGYPGGHHGGYSDHHGKHGGYRRQKSFLERLFD
jgi:hypothetical protein